LKGKGYPGPVGKFAYLQSCFSKPSVVHSLSPFE